MSAQRRRLGLTVERDGSLTLRVPEGCELHRAEDFVRASHRWIEDKLRLRQRHLPLNPARGLTHGEVFRYLGRDYRLALVDTEGAPVRLRHGELLLDRGLASSRRSAVRALTDWYSRTGLRWAQGHTQPWAGRMEVPEPTLEVRDLGRRWGTYRSGDGEGTGAGRVSLHWAVFQLPGALVDYVIAHELAHTRIAGHGPDYWRLLGRAIPECRSRKAELDEMGRRVWLGDVSR
ncbi:M48 family metallopeptidase [Streptomyces armeniacus]|uniref:M48 family metallopeptidase n=1 Tax=Streptomyces armeniacus TaxID=83291 RepID=UPI0024825808|nr:SprT family zinc-dependent metalloprotease [Streptomyces armeniacus]